jgi:hypothetical protein
MTYLGKVGKLVLPELLILHFEANMCDIFDDTNIHTESTHEHTHRHKLN